MGPQSGPLIQPIGQMDKKVLAFPVEGPARAKGWRLGESKARGMGARWDARGRNWHVGSIWGITRDRKLEMVLKDLESQAKDSELFS